MLTRRAALKAGAGALAGGTVLSGTEVGPLDLGGVSPTGEADAFIDTVVFGPVMAGAAFVDSVATTIASDPPDGLGPDTLRTQIYQDALNRKSVNASTFIDNQNLVKYMPEGTFSTGKLDAIEAIHNDATQNEAIDQGQSAAQSHFAIVEKNFLNSWNESVAEFRNNLDALRAHPDLSPMDVIGLNATDSNTTMDGSNVASGSWNINTRDVQLSDGSSFTVKSVQTPRVGMNQPSAGGFGRVEFDPLRLVWSELSSNMNDYGGWFYLDITGPSGTVSHYLDAGRWHDVWSSMQSTFSDTQSNIALWVSNTYSGIQSGDLSPGDYLSATDIANMIAADASQAQAIANFIALNVPGDYEHELTIEFDDGSIYQGFLATTDTTKVSKLTAGTSINPNATDDNGNALYETWYLAFQPRSYIEPIDSYDDGYGIQGGQIRFTRDPTTTADGQSLEGGVEYVVETSKGEQATIAPADFTQETSNGSTYWTADISDQLEETIANINRVRRVYAGEQPDTYRTMTIDQPFTVTSIDGADSATIQQNREPQTDTNYRTDEEWQTLLEQQKELIERWKKAKNSTIFGGFNFGGFPTLPGLGIIESAIAVILGILGLNAAT